jgi:hypothetical protein
LPSWSVVFHDALFPSSFRKSQPDKNKEAQQTCEISMDQMRPWTAWEFENPVHARDLLNAMEFAPCWKAPFASIILLYILGNIIVNRRYR